MPKRRVYNKRQRSYYGGPMRSDAYYRKAAIALRSIPLSLKPELKFNDEEVDNKNFSTSWITMMPADNTISGVAIGDLGNERDGRCYYIHSIHLRMFATAPFEIDSNAPLNDLIGRVMVVLDTQANGTTVVPTDIMNGAFIEDFLAFRNLNNSKRFRVLWDKTFVLRRDGQTATIDSGDFLKFHAPAPVTQVYHFNRRFKKPIKVVTLDATGNIGAISDNAIVVIGTANTTNMQLQYHSRMRFTG